MKFDEFAAACMAIGEQLRKEAQKRLEREIQADLDYGRD
jgi:hypothetical protein